MTFPINMESHKIDVPNHQPESHDITISLTGASDGAFWLESWNFRDLPLPSLMSLISRGEIQLISTFFLVKWSNSVKFLVIQLTSTFSW
jgi:hypothetical protein